jgi:DinB family protein
VIVGNHKGHEGTTRVTTEVTEEHGEKKLPAAQVTKSMKMEGLCRSFHAGNIIFMSGRPSSSEAAPYYFNYINRVASDDILTALHTQLEETLPFLGTISEEKSLFRYAPEKWSIRQLWGHVNDAERIFLMRALWFARGHESAQPSFEQEIAVAAAKSDGVPWARHVEEFREIRLATVSFFRNLPEEAWGRSGVASGNPVTVKACAYIVAGHVTHHAGVLREKYL